MIALREKPKREIPLVLIACSDKARIEGAGWKKIIGDRDLVFIVAADINYTERVIALMVFSSEQTVFSVQVSCILQFSNDEDAVVTDLYEGDAILAGMEAFTTAVRVAIKMKGLE